MVRDRRCEDGAAKAAGGAAMVAGESSVFGGVVAVRAGIAGAGRGAGAPIIGAVNGTAAAGPAALISVPAGYAGEYIGDKIADGVGLEGSGRTAAKKTSGLGAAAGGGAVIGAMAGPGGAAAGAAVGAVGYAASAAVETTIWATEGHEGTVRIQNTSSSQCTICSYNANNVTQILAVDTLELQPGQFGDIVAHKGALTFGAKCVDFKIHVWVGKTKKTSGFGITVKNGRNYVWNGRSICSK